MRDSADFEIALDQTLAGLNQASVPYMLIGGLALVAWGLPRATLDIDLTLWVPANDMQSTCLKLAEQYSPRTNDPWGFVQKTRVLPVVGPADVRIDFIFAAFPFEREMLNRAEMKLIGNVAVRVASLEDLILLKVGSSRPRDQEDVRSIIGTYGFELSWDYLLSVGGLLADALEQPEIRALLLHYKNRM